MRYSTFHRFKRSVARFFRVLFSIPRYIKYTILIVMLLVCVDVGRYFFVPDIGELTKGYPQKTAFMLNTEERWADKGIKRKITHKPVPLSYVSKYLPVAVTIAEDDKFWEHEGFDLESMRKALGHDIIEGRVKFGGSTITQQLAKNLYLSPSRNPLRKLKEAVLTWRLERELSKRRILELYINLVEWGDGIYGIEAASRKYFGKSSSALGPMQSALLASALPSPRRYDPSKPGKYLNRRARDIYSVMIKRGVVDIEY